MATSKGERIGGNAGGVVLGGLEPEHLEALIEELITYGLEV
jgi:hypothetical protein